MKRLLTTILCLTWLLAPSAKAQQEDVDARRVELGIALAKQGNLDDALRQFTLVLSRNPEHAAALNDAGNIHALLERPERALELYERALEADATDGGIHLNLALLLHEMDEANASAHHMQEGLRLVGDIEHAYYMLGLSASSGGSASRASEAERLSDREIEDLLSKALAALPQKTPPGEQSGGGEDEDTTGDDHATSEQRVQSRRTSTRAGVGERSLDRFYWKSTDETN